MTTVPLRHSDDDDEYLQWPEIGYGDERKEVSSAYSAFGKGFIAGMIIVILVGVALGRWLPDYMYFPGMGGVQAFGKEGTSERLITSGTVAGVAKKAKRFVVTVETKERPSTQGALGGDNGVGAGIVVRSDGYIVTNEHVINGAKSVTVRTGGRRLSARVVGTDIASDIAVVKVSSSRLPVPQVGPKSAVKVGQLAVAVGAPFGFSGSVSAGVISGLNRRVTVSTGLPAPRVYTGLLQTDAAINPGNSGGALVDRYGRIIGMNSLIYTTTGFSQGVGFAIPMEKVMSVATAIIKRSGPTK